MSVPHGYGLSGAERRLLRGRPPDVALGWVVTAVGGGTRVVAVRALQGGTSSAVHRLTVEDRAGHRRALVLRRHVREDWVAEEPDLARREAQILDLLEAGPVPAPRLVAVDETGADAGAPSVLMTLVPGRPDWYPADLDRYVHRLADLLPLIHATAVPPTVPRHRPYELDRVLGPPPWTRHPGAWERAIELYQGPAPSDELVLVHRDFHPGNVLWSRGRVTGLVDWVVASTGAPEVDVGHCRANLRGQFGAEVADRFLRVWQDLTGHRDYNPYWDVVAELDFADANGEPDPDLDDWVASIARA